MSYLKRSPVVAVAIAVLVLLAAMHGPLAVAGNGNQAKQGIGLGQLPIYPPAQTLYGKKMEEWSAEWWQYVFSTPRDPNPLLDPTGGYCTLVQHGPVWFLEGVTGGAGATERFCTIPRERALFFPLINLSDVNVTDQSVEELRAEIVECMDNAYDLSLVIDGEAVPLEVLQRSRVKSVPFEIVYPAEGIPTDPPIPAAIYGPGVDDGFYVMVKPLPVGEHTISFTGATPGCEYPPTGLVVGPYSIDVTYHITVEEPAVLEY
jgi:hypothetical protein